VSRQGTGGNVPVQRHSQAEKNPTTLDMDGTVDSALRQVGVREKPATPARSCSCRAPVADP
jgi:hypothetical protein